MAENGTKIEPEKYGSLLQHSFSTLMECPESDSDTISEKSSTAGGDLLLPTRIRSPRSSVLSKEINGNCLNISNQQKTDSLSPRTSSSSESGTMSIPDKLSLNPSVIIRVKVEDQRIVESGVNYRCIRLNEHDRAKAVISSALEKHCLEAEEASKWKLCQKLQNRELSLPDNANVFFGLDNSQERVIN